jgi:hypothetical protein
MQPSMSLWEHGLIKEHMANFWKYKWWTDQNLVGNYKAIHLLFHWTTHNNWIVMFHLTPIESLLLLLIIIFLCKKKDTFWPNNNICIPWTSKVQKHFSYSNTKKSQCQRVMDSSIHNVHLICTNGQDLKRLYV